MNRMHHSFTFPLVIEGALVAEINGVCEIQFIPGQHHSNPIMASAGEWWVNQDYLRVLGDVEDGEASGTRAVEPFQGLHFRIWEWLTTDAKERERIDAEISEQGLAA